MSGTQGQHLNLLPRPSVGALPAFRPLAHRMGRGARWPWNHALLSTPSEAQLGTPFLPDLSPGSHCTQLASQTPRVVSGSSDHWSDHISPLLKALSHSLSASGQSLNTQQCPAALGDWPCPPPRGPGIRLARDSRPTLPFALQGQASALSSASLPDGPPSHSRAASCLPPLPGHLCCVHSAPRPG